MSLLGRLRWQVRPSHQLWCAADPRGELLGILVHEQYRDAKVAKRAVTTFIKFGDEVLLGRVILLIKFWLANLGHDAIARLVQAAIIGLVIAMGLRAMGIA